MEEDRPVDPEGLQLAVGHDGVVGRTVEDIETPTRDPSNGVPGVDKNGRLIDEYYLFIPDSTFSGVLIFPEDILNVDSEKLNGNAKLMRTVWKARPDSN